MILWVFFSLLEKGTNQDPPSPPVCGRGILQHAWTHTSSRLVEITRPYCSMEKYISTKVVSITRVRIHLADIWIRNISKPKTFPLDTRCFGTKTIFILIFVYAD